MDVINKLTDLERNRGDELLIVFHVIELDQNQFMTEKPKRARMGQTSDDQTG